MAIGTFTLTSTRVGGKPSTPSMILPITMVGDSSYQSGGTAGFIAALKAAAITAGSHLGPILKTDIVGFIPKDLKGYQLGYNSTDDKVLVYYSNSDSSDGPQIEVANSTDLSGVTFSFAVVLAS